MRKPYVPCHAVACAAWGAKVSRDGQIHLSDGMRSLSVRVLQGIGLGFECGADAWLATTHLP